MKKLLRYGFSLRTDLVAWLQTRRIRPQSTGYRGCHVALVGIIVISLCIASALLSEIA